MAEVSAAAPAPEGVLHRRIEFHLARRPHAAVAVGGGGFQMETLNPDAADGAAAAGAAKKEAEARRPEKAEVLGLDPELTVARIYLGRIGAGLQNLGNTCYLNSVLQCLTYTEPFAAYLQSGRHKSSCIRLGSRLYQCPHYYYLNSSITSKDNNYYILKAQGYSFHAAGVFTSSSISNHLLSRQTCAIASQSLISQPLSSTGEAV